MKIEEYLRNIEVLQLDGEKWRDINESYQVSNLGRIKSKETNQIKRIILDKYGYQKVVIKDYGKSTTFSVHRLVAKFFIPNPRDLREVNHIDGDKQNNNVSNLEWCTRSENVLHAFRMGLKKNKKGQESCHAIPVYQYDLQGNFIKKWNSMVDACQAVGADSGNLSYACSGKIKTCMGYIWSYEYREIDPTKHERELNGNLVYQYTKTGELVATYKTAHEANRATGNDFSLICACCRGTRMSTGGYVWSYVPLERTSDRFKRHLGNGSKKVYQYTLNGEFVAEYDNLTIAEERTNIDKRLISSCATGKKKKAGGYIWQYEKI